MTAKPKLTPTQHRALWAAHVWNTLKAGPGEEHRAPTIHSLERMGLMRSCTNPGFCRVHKLRTGGSALHAVTTREGTAFIQEYGAP